MHATGDDFKVPMQVVPAVAARADPDVVVMTRESVAPFIQGSETPLRLVCGDCEQLLVSGVPASRVAQMVFRCPRCGSFNRLPITRSAR